MDAVGVWAARARSLFGRALKNNDLGFSHGACVSLLKSNQNNGALCVSVCKPFKKDFPAAFDARLKTLVSAFRS